MIPRLFLFGFLGAFFAAMAARATSAPSANCNNPNVAPQAIHAASLVYPTSAVALNLGTRVAIVEVVIDASGSLVEAKIVRSTGNAAMDQAALDAVHSSTFSPGTADCVPAKRAGVVRYVFNPLSRPKFQPPAGWTSWPDQEPDSARIGPANAALLQVWKRGQDALFLFERQGNEALDTSKLASEHGTVLEKTSVRICNGTQDADFVAVRRREPDPMQGYWATLLALTQSDEYVVDYYSPVGNPPDSEVKNAMLSLCVPKP
jgi:TonB family protein